MDFFLLDRDAVRTVLDLLPPHGWIACAQTCRELRVLCEEQASKPTLRLEGAEISDGFVAWLLRRIPRGVLRTLELADCTSLSRAGVTKALRFGHTRQLDTLSALRVGGASWSVDELRRLVDACSSLRVLHADCKANTTANGANQLGQLEALAAEDVALRPTRLLLQGAMQDHDDDAPAADAADADAPIPAADHVTHLPLPAAAAAAAAEAAAAAAAVGPVVAPSALGTALRRCRGSLLELDARGAALSPHGVEQVCAALAAPDCALSRLLLPGAAAVPERIEAFAEALARSPVEELQLGCSQLTSAGAATLASALPRNCALKSLQLQHCPLLDSGTRPTPRPYSTPPSPTPTLTLPPPPPPGAIALADALVCNTTLMTLHVPFTGVGDGACLTLTLTLAPALALAPTHNP